MAIVHLRRQYIACIAVSLVCFLAGAASGTGRFRFVILGDRTGEAQPGVYEQIWNELASEHPAFVLSTGDTIEGLEDTQAPREWSEIERTFERYFSIPVYLTPGNHDIWSPPSERLFREFAHHSPHYSFDYEDLHVTVLDNSRTEQLSEGELDFLEQDLEAHQRQSIKLVISHRPSWLFPALFGNPKTRLHQLARKYGVKYVVAGHLHELIHFELDGVTYLSMPKRRWASSGFDALRRRVVLWAYIGRR